MAVDPFLEHLQQLPWYNGQVGSSEGCTCHPASHRLHLPSNWASAHQAAPACLQHAVNDCQPLVAGQLEDQLHGITGMDS